MIRALLKLMVSYIQENYYKGSNYAVPDPCRGVAVTAAITWIVVRDA